MGKLSQRQSVFSAVVRVMTEHNIPYEKGVDVKPMLTKDMRSSINQILAEGFRAGEIELKDTESNRKKLSDPKEMMSYVSGLQSNWLNKDPELNGNVDYEAKNPGSRSFGNDAQLVALRNLSKTLTGTEKAEIETYITTRTNDLKVEKGITTKTISVNFDDLPEALRTKYAK